MAALGHTGHGKGPAARELLQSLPTQACPTLSVPMSLGAGSGRPRTYRGWVWRMHARTCSGPPPGPVQGRRPQGSTPCLWSHS